MEDVPVSVGTYLVIWGPNTDLNAIDPDDFVTEGDLIDDRWVVISTQVGARGLWVEMRPALSPVYN